jgi:hypothetical protein
MCISSDCPTPEAGSLTIHGRICVSQPKRDQYGFDEKKFLTAEGIAGKIEVERIIDSKPPAEIIRKNQGRIPKAACRAL